MLIIFLFSFLSLSYSDDNLMDRVKCLYHNKEIYNTNKKLDFLMNNSITIEKSDDIQILISVQNILKTYNEEIIIILDLIDDNKLFTKNIYCKECFLTELVEIDKYLNNLSENLFKNEFIIYQNQYSKSSKSTIYFIIDKMNIMTNFCLSNPMNFNKNTFFKISIVL